MKEMALWVAASADKWQQGIGANYVAYVRHSTLTSQYGHGLFTN